MAIMVEREPSFVVCPVCGDKATGYEVKPRSRGGAITTTLQPCGHRIDPALLPR